MSRRRSFNLRYRQGASNCKSDLIWRNGKLSYMGSGMLREHGTLTL